MFSGLLLEGWLVCTSGPLVLPGLFGPVVMLLPELRRKQFKQNLIIKILITPFKFYYWLIDLCGLSKHFKWKKNGQNRSNRASEI